MINNNNCFPGEAIKELPFLFAGSQISRMFYPDKKIGQAEGSDRNTETQSDQGGGCISGDLFF